MHASLTQGERTGTFRGTKHRLLFQRYDAGFRILIILSVFGSHARCPAYTVVLVRSTPLDPATRPGIKPVSKDLLAAPVRFWDRRMIPVRARTAIQAQGRQDGDLLSLIKICALAAHPRHEQDILPRTRQCRDALDETALQQRNLVDRGKYVHHTTRPPCLANFPTRCDRPWDRTGWQHSRSVAWETRDTWAAPRTERTAGTASMRSCAPRSRAVSMALFPSATRRHQLGEICRFLAPR